MTVRNKKKYQLKMDPGTASYRLNREILFLLVCETNRNNCYHCGLPMTREDFSVEHKIPWLDSEDPVKLFFDIENIAFSHQGCNTRARRITNRVEDKDGKRYCARCNEYKPIEDFPPRSNRERTACTKCYTKYRTDFRKKTGRR